MYWDANQIQFVTVAFNVKGKLTGDVQESKYEVIRK
jgi:hypothetical protein